MPHELLQQFGKTVLIGSGAIGTSLRGSGQAGGAAVELMNLRSSHTVRALHRAYRDAGSQILIANTFAANPLALEELGVADRCREINEAGVALAREAAGNDCMVWASVGPLALGLRREDYSAGMLRDLYGKQCSGLLAADVLVLETQTDPKEAEAALEAATATGLPVVFQVGNVGGGRARWERVEELIGLALARDVLAVGTNCQHPNEVVRTAGYIAGRTDLPVTAAPNAGHPAIERGCVTYDFTPEDLVRVGEELLAGGVAVVGGCCGTNPEHIRALAQAVRQRPVAAHPHIEPARFGAPSREAAAAAQANPLRELIESERRIVSVEVRADRKQDMSRILGGAAEIAEAGADMFDVPDNPGATVGRDAMVTAARLQDGTGLPAVCHKSVIQANLLQIHSSLLGCWDLGLPGLLAITGDAPSMGHLGSMVNRVTDLRSSVELLRLVRDLRSGRMINGEEVADPPDFCAGCAVGQYSPGQMRWLEAKIEAGAEFVFSQPLFSVEEFHRLHEAVAPLPVRFFPGVMPLTSLRSAEFLAGGRIPGIKVPAELVERFACIESRDEQRRFGLEYAAELAAQFAQQAGSLYLIMPFGRNCYAETAGIVRAVRSIQ